MELGTRISHWLKSRGLTQQALAAHLNVTPGAVANWVSGYAKPTTGHLDGIAEFIGVTMREFYGRIPRGKRVAA